MNNSFNPSQSMPNSMGMNPISVSLPPRYPTQLEQQRPNDNGGQRQQHLGVVQHQNGPFMSQNNQQLLSTSMSQMSPQPRVTSTTGPPGLGAPPPSASHSTDPEKMIDHQANIYKTDMPFQMQELTLDCAARALEKYSTSSEEEGALNIATYIREEFCLKYGATWICIARNDYGPMGISFSYRPGHLINFSLDQMNIVLFKSG